MASLIAIIPALQTLPFFAKLAIAFVVGFLPVLIWLWFWEHEDKHPEPKKLTVLAFVSGGISVGIALILEEMVMASVTDYTLILFFWAVIEEILKFTVAYFIVLSRAENDEPIDSMMYMIAVALGFSAVENMLFVYFGLGKAGNILEIVTIGDMRFFGATLLHVVTSSIIGLSLSLTFYRPKATQRMYVAAGVITAIVLHVIFNVSIIKSESGFWMIPFLGVWLSAVILLLVFEKVKSITH